MKEAFKNNIIDGYCFIEVCGQSFFVDSGCPATYCENNVDLRIGGKRFQTSNDPMVRQFYGVMKKQFGDQVNGLVGMDVLGQFAVLFTAEHIEFSEPGTPLPEHAVACKLIRHGHATMMDGAINELPVKFAWDSGARHALVTDQKYVDGGKFLYEYPHVHPMAGHCRVEVYSTTVQVGEFTFTGEVGLIQDNPVAAAMTAMFPFDALLGLELLQHADVLLDATHNVFAIIPGQQ